MAQGRLQSPNLNESARGARRATRLWKSVGMPRAAIAAQAHGGISDFAKCLIALRSCDYRFGVTATRRRRKTTIPLIAVGMATPVMLLAAVVGKALAVSGGGALRVRMTVRAAIDPLYCWGKLLPEWLGVTGMSVVRTTSQQCVQSNCRSRQDGDDAVQHELSKRER